MECNALWILLDLPYITESMWYMTIRYLDKYILFNFVIELNSLLYWFLSFIWHCSIINIKPHGLKYQITKNNVKYYRYVNKLDRSTVQCIVFHNVLFVEIQGKLGYVNIITHYFHHTNFFYCSIVVYEIKDFFQPCIFYVPICLRKCNKSNHLKIS